MRKLLVGSLVAGVASAFVNTNAGCKVFICATPQAAALANAAAYAALTWIEIGHVGNLGESGISTNMLSYDTWGTGVTQKAKGVSDAGSPELEVARDPADAGQDALRAAALTNLNYAFKIERNDKPGVDAGDKPTTIYNRGLVVGPRRPNGRNEDFDLEVFTLGFQDREILVDPVDGV